jgi:hypothetical protein
VSDPCGGGAAVEEEDACAPGCVVADSSERPLFVWDVVKKAKKTNAGMHISPHVPFSFHEPTEPHSPLASFLRSSSSPLSPRPPLRLCFSLSFPLCVLERCARHSSEECLHHTEDACAPSPSDGHCTYASL